MTVHFFRMAFPMTDTSAFPLARPFDTFWLTRVKEDSLDAQFFHVTDPNPDILSCADTPIHPDPTAGRYWKYCTSGGSGLRHMPKGAHGLVGTRPRHFRPKPRKGHLGANLLPKKNRHNPWGLPAWTGNTKNPPS